MVQQNLKKCTNLCQYYASELLERKAEIVPSPGNTPVGLDFQDGGIVCVVELDLWVPQLSSVDVHHDWGGAWGLSRWGHAHYFLVAPSGRAGDDGKTGEKD